MNTFIISGKLCSGKGTRLSQFRSAHSDYEVISVSAALKNAIYNNEPNGITAKKYMDAGELVPDDIVIAIIMDCIKKNKNKNIFLDGFPRSIGQAEALISSKLPISKVIEIFIEDEEVLKRSRARIVCEKCGIPYILPGYNLKGFNEPLRPGICNKCGGILKKRADDDEATVKTRLDVHNRTTVPALETLKKAGVQYEKLDGTAENVQLLFEKAVLQ